MKKLISMFLACTLCLGLLAGCQGQGGPEKEPWTLEDFSVYDENGNVTEVNPEGATLGIKGRYTKRGLYVGDTASKVLELYPLEGSGYKCFSDPGSYFGKYKDGLDCIEHIIQDNLELGFVITAAFYEEDGELKPLSLKKEGVIQYVEGQVRHDISITISDGEVIGIEIKNSIKEVVT